MKREEKNEAKRQSILDAALRVFAAKGFAATRMDEVARDAGVAKGTIYIHFKDKEDLFAAILKEVLMPQHTMIVQTLERNDLSLREKLWRIGQPFMENNGISRVGKAIQLTHAEGLHNPPLIRWYLEMIVNTVRRLQEHMRAADLPKSLCAHPELLMAPLLHGVIWQGLLSDMAPIDMQAMYRTHLDMIFAGRDA